MHSQYHICTSFIHIYTYKESLNSSKIQQEKSAKKRALQLGPHFDPSRLRRLQRPVEDVQNTADRGCSRGQHTSAIYTYAAAAMLCLWRLLLLFVREAESERAIPKLVKRGSLTASSTSLSEKKNQKRPQLYTLVLLSFLNY